MWKPIVPIGALLIALTASSAKADTIVEYAWSPDASYTDGTGNIEYLSGGFQWDATTENIVADSTSISGPDLTATYSLPPDGINGINSLGFSEVNASDPTSNSLTVNFVNDLGLGQNDPLAVSASYVTSVVENAVWFPAASVTGGVDVPEPATMSVVGVGLAGLSFIRRRRAKRASA